VEEYADQQYVGIDLHRRRSVIVRTSTTGEVLENVQITNDVEVLTEVIRRAGETPEIVLEATYGWYWAVDALQAAGEGLRVPAGQERLPGCARSGGSDAVRPSSAGLDCPAGDPGAAGTVAAQGQTGRAAHALQGADPCCVGQVRNPGPDERLVRRYRYRVARGSGRSGVVQKTDEWRFCVVEDADAWTSECA
jgi:hypothetical protein